MPPTPDRPPTTVTPPTPDTPPSPVTPSTSRPRPSGASSGPPSPSTPSASSCSTWTRPPMVTMRPWCGLRWPMVSRRWRCARAGCWCRVWCVRPVPARASWFRRTRPPGDWTPRAPARWTASRCALRRMRPRRWSPDRSGSPYAPRASTSAMSSSASACTPARRPSAVRSPVWSWRRPTTSSSSPGATESSVLCRAVSVHWRWRMPE